MSNGWDQYVDVARSNEFQHAFWVTVKFALLTVPIGLVLGVGLAVLADKYLRGLAVFRFIFTSTIATSVAVASLMWLFLLQPDIGVLANVGWVADLFPVVKAPGLLRDPGTALASVAASSIWAEPRVHVPARHGRAAGHPARPPRGGRRRRRRRHPALLEHHRADARPDAAVRAHRAHDARLPGVRRDRPADPRRAAAAGLDDDDHLPDLRHRLDHQQQPRAAVGAAVLLFLVMLVLSVVQLAGIGRRVHYA